MMTGPGMRNSMMTSIGVHERYKGTAAEDIEKLLLEWAKHQNPDYITDPWSVVSKDATNIARWVWSDAFVAVDRKLVISRGDLEEVLQRHGRLQKRLLLLTILYTYRYGKVHMTVDHMCDVVGGCHRSVCAAMQKLESEGLVEKQRKKPRHFEGKGFVGGANAYVYRHQNKHEVGGGVEVDWDFKTETFCAAYLDIMRKNVPPAERHQYFTAKELEELEGANHAEDCAAV